MYHHINWHEGDLVTLTPKDFENHLRFLARQKVQTLFVDELVSWLQKREKITRPAAALTFDDGYLDNWVYAFPLLKKYQSKATIFIVTSWISEGDQRKAWMGKAEDALPPIPTHQEGLRRISQGDYSPGLHWAEAQEMIHSGLVDIQSHTHFHHDYFIGRNRPQLDPAQRDLLVDDLARSQELLEQKLGQKCRYLSWPWGRYDGEAVALAQGLGFEALATTDKGVNYPGSNPMAIKRIVTKSGKDHWFPRRWRIYSHRFLGQLYSRVVGRI